MPEQFEPFESSQLPEAQMEERSDLFKERVQELAAKLSRRVSVHKEFYEPTLDDLLEHGGYDGLTPEEQDDLRKAVGAEYAEMTKFKKHTSAARQIKAGRIPRGVSAEERRKALFASMSSGTLEADRRRSDRLLKEAEERELNQE